MRRRVRAIFRWAGLVLTNALAGLFGVSIFYGVQWLVTPAFAIGVVAGEILVRWVPSGSPFSADSPLGLHINRNPPAIFFKFGLDEGLVVQSAWVPLPVAFLLIAAPTLWAWRGHWRRRRPGHCAKCGYDLRGLTATLCPECGQSGKFGGAQS